MELSEYELEIMMERAASRALAKYQLEQDRSLSIDEAKDYLGVSRGTIYNMIKEDKLRPHFVRGLQKFTKAELDREKSASRSSVSRHV
jgi:excisionase family DNA binding protein